MCGLLIHLLQLIRLFAPLMVDRRVPLLAKLAAVLGLLLLLTLPTIELHFIPVIGQLDWLLGAISPSNSLTGCAHPT